MRTARVCCSSRRPIEPAVFSSREQCEADSSCAQVARALETDFARRHVIVASPQQMGITYTPGESPTTLGDEWRIYQGLRVRCHIGVQETEVLAARADAGGGSVVYAGIVPKLAEQSRVSCTCE
jgi:hypothetical protein